MKQFTTQDSRPIFQFSCLSVILCLLASAIVCTVSWSHGSEPIVAAGLALAVFLLLLLAKCKSSMYRVVQRRVDIFKAFNFCNIFVNHYVLVVKLHSFSTASVLWWDAVLVFPSLCQLQHCGTAFMLTWVAVCCVDFR